MRDTIWLSVLDDTNRPIAAYADPSRSTPRYPPMAGPQSRSPSSSTVTGIDRVRTSAVASRITTARNLPRARWTVLTGSVRSISRVPARCSSLHWRMVSVATSSIISTGIHRNRGRTSAMLRAKKVSAQKKRNSVAARNTPMKIRARGEPK